MVGAIFLFIPAALEKSIFFSILEAILIVGATMAFLPVSIVVKSVISIGLGVIAAIYFGISGQLRDYLTWLSVLGILLGTWGYAITNPILYFCAGATLTTYAFCSYRRGDKIALVFFILDSLFTLTAFLEIFKII